MWSCRQARVSPRMLRIQSQSACQTCFWEVTMEIKRDTYLASLISKKHNGLTKVITGLRRCGKSYLLFTLFKNHLLAKGTDSSHILEMNFDFFENKQFRDPNVFYPHITGQIKDSGMYYILLDEIQMLDDFVAVLNSLNNRKNVDVYVTGSNARFLSKDVATEFGGRGIAVHMYPLSFAEFMSVYQDSQEKCLTEYMLYGGLPQIALMNDPEEKTSFLKDILDETYIKDIIRRHKIRKTGELNDILNILASLVGSLTNPTKLSKSFKSMKQNAISKNTIEKYIDYLCDSFLIDQAIRYDVKGKKYINTPYKYYFTDLGLRNTHINFRQIEETHAMENIIFNELKIRGFSVDVGVVPFNKTNKAGNGQHVQYEIDFVCNKGSKRYYIQSAFSVQDKEKLAQEQRPLLLTKDGFKKVIITKDCLTPHYNDDGILILSLLQFLLNRNSLDF